MSVVLVGLNHQTAPVRIRERFAFAKVDLPPALDRLCQSGFAEEAVILSTCNRVELYVATCVQPQKAFAALETFLLESHGGNEALEDASLYRMIEPESLVHLCRVASGLDSMVLGETEILGQIKRAYAVALRHRVTGRVLNKVFQYVFRVAKQVRTETGIQRGHVSLGSIAAEVAEKIFTSLAGQDVLVIGAGEISQKVAQAIQARGARNFTITNRSFPRAETLAFELNGCPARFGDWDETLARASIVITGTAAPHYVLTRAKLEPLLSRRQDQLLLLLDLAVPRNIDPEVRLLKNVYLYDLDDLQALAAAGLSQRQTDLARCEGIIAEQVCALRAFLSPNGTPDETMLKRPPRSPRQSEIGLRLVTSGAS
jgi:glutamyl-tRNA reductase